MLFALPVWQLAVLDGLDSEIKGHGAGGGCSVEDVCDDRVADRVWPCAGTGYFGDAEAAEPLNVESHVDCAKGGDRGFERSAGFCSGDAGRIQEAARLHCGTFAGYAGRGVLYAGRGILCVSQCSRSDE